MGEAEADTSGEPPTAQTSPDDAKSLHAASRKSSLSTALPSDSKSLPALSKSTPSLPSPTASKSSPKAADRRKERTEILEGVTQYTALAQNLKRKGLLSRAVRMMERAVLLCSRVENDHPTVALEAARARMNLGSYLSEAERHSEALAAVKDAQVSLGKVLAWARECEPGDESVKPLEQEARALRAAALVAESIELEAAVDGDAPPRTLDEDLVDEARQTAWDLGRRHPLSTMLSSAIGPARPPPVRTAALLVPAAAATPVSQRSDRGRPESLAQGEEPAAPAATPQSRQSSKRGNKPQTSPPRPSPRQENGDVFKQYLREREEARVAHLLALSDDWEQQTKRKLQQVHRTTKLQIESTPEEVTEELKEKRYTHTGHRISMQAYKKANRCYSDSSLVREARRERAAPEVQLMRKLNRKLNVKPPPPPPPPPPKPKIDSSLAGNLKSGAGAASAAIKSAEEGKAMF